MGKENQNRGITLVALIVTIIILLILAGITISSLTGSGLFAKSEEAKERTIKAQLKEKIEMAIQEIQIEELPKGNSVTLETLANGQLVAKLTEITSELGTDEVTGEYKDYDYTIDSNFKVKIEGKVGGIKPTGTAEILTTNYMFEGDGTVEIKVTANITEGTITGIEEPEGAVLVTDISTTEKVYTVGKSGTYIFSIEGNSGRKVNVIANVKNILETPRININEIMGDGFKINVENNYPEGVITEYKYYVENEIKNEETTNTSYTVTGLNDDTIYNNVKVVAYINSTTNKESNIESVTTLGDWSETYKTTSDYIDEYGNVAKIPEGFQVSTKKGQTNINEGLVVRNAEDRNEFVWIPVGTIYTNVERTESKTIELNRYTFDSNGVETSDDSLLAINFSELETSPYGNTTAKSITDFKNSVEKNKGYYIGRYEARISSSGAVTEIGTDSIYNGVTQPGAATAAKNMYDETKPFISDLMNSYAWDTAILFLQKFGDNPIYSRKISVNIGGPAITGTNDTTKYTGTQDVQCNVYDIAGNITEWTTETYYNASYAGVSRGGYYYSGALFTCSRNGDRINCTDAYYGFRPLLYIEN